jgi:hypothetical protein
MNETTKFVIRTIFLILILAGIIYDIYRLWTSDDSEGFKYANAAFLLITIVFFFWFSKKYDNGFAYIARTIWAPKANLPVSEQVKQ